MLRVGDRHRLLYSACLHGPSEVALHPETLVQFLFGYGLSFAPEIVRGYWATQHATTFEPLGTRTGYCNFLFKSLRLRPPTPEAYGKTADFGTLCIPGSSQRLDTSAALLSSSDRSRLAALNVMLTPCPVP